MLSRRTNGWSAAWASVVSVFRFPVARFPFPFSIVVIILLPLPLLINTNGLIHNKDFSTWLVTGRLPASRLLLVVLSR